MRTTFCGVRGSCPSPGRDFLRYGGQTSCLALAHDGAAPSLLLDAGSGMTAVAPLVDGAFVGTVLLTHLHWDHTHGMPFFGPGFAPGHRVDVLLPDQGEDAEGVLERCFSPPHFPIVPRQLGDGWSFGSVDEGWHEVEGFRVLAREVPHKGGRTFGYRVEAGGASLAYFPDHSPTALGPGPDGTGERHEAALELARDVDVLVTDAQHLQSQFPGVQFLGHASVEYDVALAREAGAATLVLFHHAPSRTDDELDAVERLAQELAGPDLRVLAAHEGLVLDLPDTDRERSSGGAVVQQLQR